MNNLLIITAFACVSGIIVIFRIKPNYFRIKVTVPGGLGIESEIKKD